MITAKGTGNAIITGYNISDTSAVLTYELTVGEQGMSNPVTSIKLDKNTLSMEALESETLQAEVFPAAAENKELAWSSSNEAVASVDEKGRVSAHTKGTAETTVTAQDGSGVSKSCMVTVTNNAYICSSVEELESIHNYPDNCSDFWVYTKEGAQTLYLTFDDRTELEDSRDYLYVYDNEGTQIGKYTGKQLAGKSIEVSGDSVKIKLVSDSTGTAWGFKVTSVRGSGDADNNEYLVTFDSQGGTSVSAVIVTKGAAVDEPEPPVKKNYLFIGWYLDGKQYDFTKPVTKNIVLKAKWQRTSEEEQPDDSEKIPEGDIPASGIIPDGLWIAGVTDQTYTRKALKPEVRVYHGSRRLKAGT
ncbi:MAG: Ig-like domain-containing protein, partial [Lachnospiraceae bacterium]|nr:Ig-like domain-containing protein [Lachnospiraceae bacterium]